MLLGLLVDGMLKKCEPDCTEFGERMRFDPSLRGRMITPNKGRANTVPSIVTSFCLIDVGNGTTDMLGVFDTTGFALTVAPLLVTVVVAVAALPSRGVVCPSTCVTVIIDEPSVIMVVPRIIAGGRVGVFREVVESVFNCGAVLVESSASDIGVPKDMRGFEREGIAELEFVLWKAGLILKIARLLYC
jgi:hypothetical protein